MKSTTLFMEMLNLNSGHAFPFANDFLSDIGLSVSTAIERGQFMKENIDTLISRINYMKSVLNDISDALYVNTVFELEASKFSPIFPFYVWDHSEYNKEINNLLEGKEVVLTANVKDIKKMNAIKFNEVRLSCVLKTPKKQQDFIEAIINFEVQMMTGINGYYRCGDRIYYIPFEKPYVTKYIPQKTKNNLSRVLVANSTAFLSPYTTWKLQLHNRDSDAFVLLKEFEDQVVKLVLEGKGSGLEDKEILKKYCNADLDRYYRFDSIDTL